MRVRSGPAAAVGIWLSVRQRFLFVLLTGCLCTPSAHASLLRACRPSDSPLVCRLESFLTLLYAAAGILLLLLICAVLAAVRAYRRKSRKLTPDDITPDAQ